MARLGGKTAFLTAAGQGIGAATARVFADEGARVIATDAAEGGLARLKETHPAIETRLLDARDTAAVEVAIEEAGAVDVLFNCAGWVHHGTILDCDEEAWDRSFDLNAKSMWRTIRAALPGMIERGGGSVVNMASVVSSEKGVPNRAAYAATKGAVIGLTKAVAADFISRGVRCNAICPGTIETPSLEERMRALPVPYAEARAAFLARQPMGRMGSAEEVARLAVYLASDESAFVTGECIRIDGGMAL